MNTLVNLRRIPADIGAQSASSRWNSFPTILSLLLFAVVGEGWLDAAPGKGGVELPRYAVYATVTCEMFGQERSEAQYTSEVLFCYSNGWWEIEQVLNGPPAVAGTHTSCKRIPDGVRYLTVPAGWTNADSLLPASAKPMAFPPPEQIAHLICWLSLCPNPELPILDSRRMQMFTVSDIMPHPRNRCDYSASYFEPEGTFLSALYITNNGVLFQIQADPISYPPPFHNGFLQFSYEVLETTNSNGFRIPSRTILKTLGTRNNAKSRSDLYEASVQRFQLNRFIALSANDEVPRLGSIPRVLISLDRRPPALPRDATVDYLVTNDAWVAVTNPRIVALASMKRRLAKESKSDPYYLFVFLAAVALFPAATWLVRRKIKRKPSEKG